MKSLCLLTVLLVAQVTFCVAEPPLARLSKFSSITNVKYESFPVHTKFENTTLIQVPCAHKELIQLSDACGSPPCLRHNMEYSASATEETKTVWTPYLNHCLLFLKALTGLISNWASCDGAFVIVLHLNYGYPSRYPTTASVDHKHKQPFHSTTKLTNYKQTYKQTPKLQTNQLLFCGLSSSHQRTQTTNTNKQTNQLLFAVNSFCFSVVLDIGKVRSNLFKQDVTYVTGRGYAICCKV